MRADRSQGKKKVENSNSGKKYEYNPHILTINQAPKAQLWPPLSFPRPPKKGTGFTKSHRTPPRPPKPPKHPASFPIRPCPFWRSHWVFPERVSFAPSASAPAPRSQTPPAHFPAANTRTQRTSRARAPRLLPLPSYPRHHRHLYRQR